MQNIDTNFAKEKIDKTVFEKDMLIGIGRDLKLSQADAQFQCRKNSTKLHQLWLDGFTIQFSLECFAQWVHEYAQTDDDLHWHLYGKAVS